MTSLETSGLPKRIRLTPGVGRAKSGAIFVLGLHGVPEHDLWKDTTPDDFYWREGSAKADNDFLYRTWVFGSNPETGEKWSYAEPA